ncbi:hypothetical protein [Rhodanobacter glycinis]|nr:hypothetical protein [Rhodanobacter glycinis]
MNFPGWNTSVLGLVMALGAVSPSSFAGQQKVSVGQAVVAGVAAPEFKIDRSVEDLATVYCPRGLERFLPGSYYYCVGVRDMAKGNNARSREMLRIAASWGNKSAQFLLGMGYFKGDVEPLDRPLGLAWMGLASERRDPTYAAIFSSAWKGATTQEQARAQELWRSMLPTYGDARAARRAELRFKHERDALVSNAAYGARVCISGLSSNQVVSARPRNDDTLCSYAQPVDFVAKKLDVYAEQLFDGWSGHVMVGPMKIVPSSPN